MKDCLTPEGVQVCEEMCDTCIFRPGNLMSLQPGRVAGMVAEVKANDSYVRCHKTLDDRVGAVCRGSFDRIKTQPIQLAERLGFICWVHPDND